MLLSLCIYDPKFYTVKNEDELIGNSLDYFYFMNN